MDREINERFVKISSKLPVFKDFDYGDEIEISFADNLVKACVVKIDGKDNQDGTIDKIYIFKLIS